VWLTEEQFINRTSQVWDWMDVTVRRENFININFGVTFEQHANTIITCHKFFSESGSTMNESQFLPMTDQIPFQTKPLRSWRPSLLAHVARLGSGVRLVPVFKTSLRSSVLRQQGEGVTNWGVLSGGLTSYRSCEKFLNPLMGTGNYSVTLINMKLVHWPLMGELLHLVQRGAEWAALSHSRSFEMTLMSRVCVSPY